MRPDRKFLCFATAVVAAISAQALRSQVARICQNLVLVPLAGLGGRVADTCHFLKTREPVPVIVRSGQGFLRFQTQF
jgi:hypothetical protein